MAILIALVIDASFLAIVFHCMGRMATRDREGIRECERRNREAARKVQETGDPRHHQNWRWY